MRWVGWFEGQCEAHNVEVVVGDLFATCKPLKSHAAEKVLPHIATFVPLRPSCVRIRRWRLSNIDPESRRTAAASFSPASVRSHSRQRPSLRCDLTEPSRLNPQDSRFTTGGGLLHPDHRATPGATGRWTGGDCLAHGLHRQRELAALAHPLAKTSYGVYLIKLLEGL